MLPITSYTIGANFEAASGADENDARQRRAAKIKINATQPVMNQSERKTSEKLLREALSREKKKASTDPSPASLLQGNSSSINKKDISELSRPLQGDQPFPELNEALHEELQIGVSHTNEQKKEEQQEMASLSRQLADIETNMQKSKNRTTRQDVSMQLSAIYDQLKNQKNNFSSFDKKTLKDMACSIDFMEGYYEASSNNGNNKHNISESLSNIRIALEEAALITTYQAPSAITTEKILSQNNAAFRADAVSSKELQHRRELDRNEQLDEFSGTENRDAGFVSRSGSKKSRNSSVDLISSSRLAKNQKDSDDKREDTLPLTTLRSI